MGRFTPPQLVIASFLCAIIIGAIALSLPQATNEAGRMGLVDSLFTATSATCVTGLVVKDTGSYFTRFGRTVIFVLFQIGGLGIMTFSTLFAVMLGRRISFHQTDIVRSTLNEQNNLGLKKLIAYIIGITLAIETVGAALLFFRWRAITDWTVLATVERAVFHSVSAFCNAGLALFRTSFSQFAQDSYINATMIFLIIVGGIGFVVIMDIIGLFDKASKIRKLSLQSKVALITSAALILVGIAAFFIFEKNNTFQGMSLSEKILGSTFQSVTARTAGFNTMPIGRLATPTLLILIALMFIGASPGSTGGGIKTCTFAILVATAVNMLRNKKQVMFLNRSIPQQVVRESLVIFFLGFTWVFAATVLVTFFQTINGGEGSSLIKSLFEVVSAFGTVGLSTGITQNLDNASKLCITATMFAGRVGPLTLALAVAFREKHEKYLYPEENIMVG